MTYSQYLGRSVLIRLRGRVYEQTGAKFWRDAIDYQAAGPAGQYFTGDRELAPLRDLLVGGKLSYLATGKDGEPLWGIFDELDLHLKADALWSEALTETVPGLDPRGATPESIVLQLGLQVDY
jgi:hypothetical protein